LLLKQQLQVAIATTTATPAVAPTLAAAPIVEVAPPPKFNREKS